MAGMSGGAILLVEIWFTGYNLQNSLETLYMVVEDNLRKSMISLGAESARRATMIDAQRLSSEDIFNAM
uniref:Uncharacterized protein n=1 Tax=Lepeophtheirus salmonis TaxID=72036 RepID=A0A0K2V8B0_LEPSM